MPKVVDDLVAQLKYAPVKTIERDDAQAGKSDELSPLTIHAIRTRYEAGDALARIRHDLGLNVPLSRLQSLTRKPYR